MDSDGELSVMEYKSKVEKLVSSTSNNDVSPFITDAVMYVYRDWSKPNDPKNIHKQYMQVVV